MKTIGSVLLFIGLSATMVMGQDAQRPKPPEPDSLVKAGASTPERSPAEKYFSDVELLDQDGAKLRFYSDVLKNKVVVINTFFTTCTSICPPMNRNFEKIQEALGDRLGKEVFLVSISVDPETDTPPRLKEYGKRFHARPGWIFLTGKKENVDWALYKLGQYVETKDEHTSIFIIGNEPKGLWKKAIGLAKAEELIRIVEDVIADR
ncbi:MAG TPA: SCO family protein [Pyrinomonadaceae bacterium]|nr:SCO family protein [Pyrinomonadaceae bacterium]